MSRRIRLRLNEWNPALHPRDSEGKFTERPYDVPDELIDKPTQQIMAELYAEDPEFEERVEGMMIDMGDYSPKEINSIIENAKQDPSIVSGPSAEQRSLFEDSEFDVSFSTYQDWLSQVKEDFPVDNTGAWVMIENGDVSREYLETGEFQ